MRNYINLMRPYQWVKNLFCFAGVIFGLHFTNHVLILAATLCFIAFCFMSSAVYVLNDIFDVEVDRAHPRKKNRPLAANLISINQAWALFILLTLLAAVIALLVNYKIVLTVLLYLIINIYYSIKAKHIVILDVFLISIGFLLRTFAGTIGIGIPLSAWLVLCVIMLTLFLGFAKRKAELILSEVQANVKLKRKVLEYYDPRMLDIFIAVTATSAIVSYALFVVLSNTHSLLIFTIIFVMYGIFRYIYLLYNKDGGQDTANDLLDDQHLIVTVILWLLVYLAVIVQ